MFKLNNDDKLSFFALKWRPHLCAGWEEEAVSGEQLIVRVKPRVGCAVHLEKKDQTFADQSQANSRWAQQRSVVYLHWISPPSTPPLFPQLSLADTTEYTQSGNCHFLVYIPSWWKNQPSLVRVGGAHPPRVPISTNAYKAGVYAPAVRADTLPLFLLCGCNAHTAK
jgi:hypothetical protein